MLPSELLRTKISKGKMIPLFCTTNLGNGTDYELANKLIVFFSSAQENKQCKGNLQKKIDILESEYDYKLVRAFVTLLERRSVFDQPHISSTNAAPTLIRQKLFEESSKQCLALSDSQRQEIIQKIADQMHVTSEDIQTIMWNDKDENLVLTQFDVINPKDLILWYNLSLFQTLLFKCIKMEFYVKGGLYWKRVLRDVKKYGLMYNLEYYSEDNIAKDDGNVGAIKCVLEGPLSMFKMTDRYGTSMAKLLPSIVGTPIWEITGSIVRQTDDGKKIYPFELSSKNTHEFLRVIVDSQYQNNNDYVYDSSTEAVFAKRFHQYFDQNDKFGWKIYREPDPLIADGKAMIPDFLFERFGRRVYLEIVGFWTKEYLERKASKIKALFANSKNPKHRQQVDLLVAVNSELSCSEIETIFQDRIFTFKKEVSLKPILEHLKKIDAEITAEKIDNTQITLDEGNLDLLFIKQIAKNNSVPEEAALKILLDDYPDKYVSVGSYLISKEKINLVNNALDGISEFVAACKVMISQKIPDSCHAELLSKMGYDVVWADLDPNHTVISKKQNISSKK